MTSCQATAFLHDYDSIAMAVVLLPCTVHPLKEAYPFKILSTLFDLQTETAKNI